LPLEIKLQLNRTWTWSVLTDHICGETAAVGVDELQHSEKDGGFDV